MKTEKKKRILKMLSVFLVCGYAFVGQTIYLKAADGPYATNPDPPDGAEDVSIETNLTWVRGAGAKWDLVYFGTDPCDANLTLVATIPDYLPAEYDPCDPPLVTDPNLLASTTYYWYITEVNSPNDYQGPVWSFTTVSGKAQCDYPEDRAVIPGDIYYPEPGILYTELIFIPGPTAVQHTGYFSKVRDEVANRAEDAKILPPIWPPIPHEHKYIVGGPGESLVRGQVYYWTDDETDSFGNVFLGDIWEFTIQDYYAYVPSPPNEATLIDTDVLLTWHEGYGAQNHDVFIGTSWEDVNNAYFTYPVHNSSPEYVDTTDVGVLSYQMNGLDPETRYYWRIDEIQGRMAPSVGTIYKGDIWCFTTVISVETYHVDGATGDNTNDGLTRETAFETIQWGINAAGDYETVLVWPGVYNEEISFWGDAITVKSAADAAIVETDYGYAFSFFSAEGPNTVLSNFVIKDSQYGIYLINGSSPILKNLTIVNNDFGISAFNGADPDISNCILWGNYYGDLFREPVPLEARYSCIEDGGEGEGNISVEPGFVDANGGDYHLLSERGRYWPAHDVWVLDDVTSPCIDGGDPAVDPANERMPNGGRINMGAYGNTAYASMSEWPIKGDINNDGRFNFVDIAILLDEWLAELPWAQ